MSEATTWPPPVLERLRLCETQKSPDFYEYYDFETGDKFIVSAVAIKGEYINEALIRARGIRVSYTGIYEYPSTDVFNKEAYYDTGD